MTNFKASGGSWKVTSLGRKGNVSIGCSRLSWGIALLHTGYGYFLWGCIFVGVYLFPTQIFLIIFLGYQPAFIASQWLTLVQNQFLHALWPLVSRTDIKYFPFCLNLYILSYDHIIIFASWILFKLWRVWWWPSWNKVLGKFLRFALVCWKRGLWVEDVSGCFRSGLYTAALQGTLSWVLV